MQHALAAQCQRQHQLRSGSTSSLPTARLNSPSQLLTALCPNPTLRRTPSIYRPKSRTRAHTCRHETSKRGGEGKYNWGAEGDEAAYGAGAGTPELDEEPTDAAVAAGGNGEGLVDGNGADDENEAPAEPEVRSAVGLRMHTLEVHAVPKQQEISIEAFVAHATLCRHSMAM